DRGCRETKHLLIDTCGDHTYRCSQKRHCFLKLYRICHGIYISLRTIAAPALKARSFALATARDSGTIPQLVEGYSSFASTNFRAFRMVLATSSGVSTTSVATSIAPTIIFFPLKSSIRSIGTFEL